MTACLALGFAILSPPSKPCFSTTSRYRLTRSISAAEIKAFFRGKRRHIMQGNHIPPFTYNQPAYLSISYRTSSRLDDNYHHRPSSSHRTIHDAKQAFPTNPSPYHTTHHTRSPHTNNHKRRFFAFSSAFSKTRFHVHI